MKTINDLVKRLNIFFGYGDFYIDKDDEMNSYTLCINYLGSHDGLVEFDKEYKDWIVEPKFGLAPAEIQKMIMDFIYTTDKEHWFDEQEKKYNIIIGEDVGTKWKAAYRKLADDIGVMDTVKPEALTLAKYIFTESEIEDLKSKVSEHSAKIIDLGKVEVKDENN